VTLWSALRDARYALPGRIERAVPGPDANAIAALGARLPMGVTYGYFPGAQASADDVEAANRALIAAAGRGSLSLKAPHLGFDAARIGALAQAARKAGMEVVFDAHAPGLADATLALAGQEHGCVLPARWRRSLRDAECLLQARGRLRIVKGEWADPDGDPDDVGAAYLALIARAAGRGAMVSVATHDPDLAERALRLLLDAGTPCELEQLRGLPRRRTMAVARKLGVPVRLYLPFGPGWWPYAVDKALARPYLPLWMLRDLLG